MTDAIRARITNGTLLSAVVRAAAVAPFAAAYESQLPTRLLVATLTLRTSGTL